MKLVNKQNKHLINRLTNKASISPSKVKIAAIAFTKRNNVLGIESNGFRELSTGADDCFYGKGKHAEMALIKKFGRKISTIYLFRVGHSGNPLPIDPCPACAKAAQKLGIRIISLTESIKTENV